MKQWIRYFTFVVIGCGIGTGTAYAQGRINVQNGNINHYYIDIQIPSHGYPLKLERSFNSKSTFNGMFGHKWGSNFETTFTVTPEGLVEISEFGDGFKTTFAPKTYSQKELDAFMQSLLNKLPPASRTAKIKESLLTDALFRRKLAKEHNLTVDIPLQTALYANDRGPETLLKTTKSGDSSFIWIRSFAGDKQEVFNHKGQLIRRQDPNGNFLNLSYDTQGRLFKVVDRFGRQMTFSYHPNKKVAAVTSPAGKTCVYKYDLKGNLLYAKNDRGYDFTYKSDDLHHMREVVYPTGQKEIMKYDLEDRITHHEGPDDTQTTYQYDTQGDPFKYFNVIVTKERGKKPNQSVTVDKYEYEFGRRDNGSRYAYKLATVLDGIRTETLYTPCCGKPISINRQGKITRFEYAADGSLTKKIFPDGQRVELSYDKNFKKVSQVVQFDPKRKITDTTEYKYDPKGNLAFARNKNQKISVQLVYDRKGRIEKLVDQKGQKITFEYNTLGKPTKITLQGVGSILVSYNAGGEITNVKSTGSRKIASEVTGAFQSLLDVIRPAGVSLGI